ncbi:MAG: UbiA family prenyltransferase [Chthoniobacteraceae bacterium]
MKAWLQLFRVPNLFTVPGDPLAGFLIATGGRLDMRALCAVLASLAIYAAGLAMNDLADFAEDKTDRPKRPLPSGAIPRNTAWFVTVNLTLFGLVLCYLAGPQTLLMGIGTVMGVVLYNFITKKIPVIGALNMGVCRGMSLLLGAAAGLGPDPQLLDTAALLARIQPVVAATLIAFAPMSGQRFFVFAIGAALLVAIYIAAVTNLARFETRKDYPKIARILPLASLLIGFVILKQATDTMLRDQSPALWLVAIMLCAMNTAEIMRDPPAPLPPRIGGFIRILPVMQAALCVLPSVPGPLRKTPVSLLVALLLLACVPVHAWLGKKFYAS